MKIFCVIFAVLAVASATSADSLLLKHVLPQREANPTFNAPNNTGVDAIPQASVDSPNFVAGDSPTTSRDNNFVDQGPIMDLQAQATFYPGFIGSPLFGRGAYRSYNPYYYGNSGYYQNPYVRNSYYGYPGQYGYGYNGYGYDYRNYGYGTNGYGYDNGYGYPYASW